MFQAFCSVRQSSWRKPKIISARGFFWEYKTKFIFLSHYSPLNVCCLQFIQGDYIDSWKQYVFCCFFFFNLRRCILYDRWFGSVVRLKKLFSLFSLHRDHFSSLIYCHIIFYLSLPYSVPVHLEKATKTTPGHYFCRI